MSSKSFVVNQLSETAHAAVRVPGDDSDKQPIRTNNRKLEEFAIKIAWAFASIAVLLVTVSLFLVVAGFAGSNLAPH